MEKRTYAIDYSRNLNVELLRIFLTLAVCLHHFRMYSDALPYGGGYVAVDCFFIISGFYLARHVLSNREGEKESALQYAVKRYCRLFPEYFIAFVISFLIRLGMNEMLPDDWTGYIKEATMIEFWCLNISERINPPDWYCGYLLLASIVIFIYMKWICKYNISIYLTGIIAIVLYALLAAHNSHINLYPQYRVGLSIAIFRSLAGLLLGCFVYLLDNKLCSVRNFERNKALYILMLPLGIGLAYILLWENSLPYIDYVAIFFFALLFFMAINIRIKNHNIYIRSIVEYLGRMSFTVYLNHYIVAYVFDKYSWFRLLDWKLVSMLFVIVVFIFSGAVFQVINACRLLIRSGDMRR